MLKMSDNLPKAIPLNPTEGTHSVAVSYVLELKSLNENKKIDMKNPEQVKERITDFFNACAKYEVKPLVTGLALALGISRRQLSDIANGCPTMACVNIPEVRNLIQQSYNALDALYEQYVMTGAVNPAAGIFTLKNHFGYTDTQTATINIVNPFEKLTPQQIEEKINADIVD